MRERAFPSGRVAQSGLGPVRRAELPFSPDLADWSRDTDELLSAVRVRRDVTVSAAPSFAPGSLSRLLRVSGGASRSGPSLRSPHYHRGTPDATSGRPGRGERSAHTDAVPGPASGSASPRNHAREAQALPLGQVGARLESPAPDPSGTDLAPAPLVVCARCRLPIRKNPALPISFCELHGLTEFVFIPRRRRP